MKTILKVFRKKMNGKQMKTISKVFRKKERKTNENNFKSFS